MAILSANRRLALAAALAALATASSAASGAAQEIDPDSERVVPLFLQLLGDGEAAREALAFVERHWRPGFTPMVLEVVHLTRDPQRRARLLRLLEAKTRQRHGGDLDAWYRWLWAQEPRDHPHYADFKAALYGLIDPRFRAYFSSARKATIRLDEVRWGGVVQDGIPPLRAPKMIAAKGAGYLDDSDVVFGLELQGDARAYPRRILAWHEMFVDTVGGVAVAGVYCTLCGSMILYETEHQGTRHELGTSGFLYRSNKLMYDRATQSLWNTLWGRPVIGPLVGRGIELALRPVVTTTWGEWRRRHPRTRVLSLDTGHQRDYSEGAAYRDYFATDALMFTVPELDRRLRNKAEVLALTLGGEPLAVSAAFLDKKRLYQDSSGGVEFVVLTDRSGANRVYETRGRTFERWDDDRTAVDSSGVEWTLAEDRLTSADGAVLERLPAHRAFWFGWRAAYPETRLVR